MRALSRHCRIRRPPCDAPRTRHQFLSLCSYLVGDPPAASASVRSNLRRRSRESNGKIRGGREATYSCCSLLLRFIILSPGMTERGAARRGMAVKDDCSATLLHSMKSRCDLRPYKERTSLYSLSLRYNGFSNRTRSYAAAPFVSPFLFFPQL